MIVQHFEGIQHKSDVRSPHIVTQVFDMIVAHNVTQFVQQIHQKEYQIHCRKQTGALEEGGRSL